MMFTPALSTHNQPRKPWQSTLYTLSACAVLVSGSALAADAGTNDWTGNFTISFEQSSGSNDITDLNASFTVQHNQNFQQSNPVRHSFSAASDSEKTKISGVSKTTRDKKSAAYVLGYYLDKPSHIDATIAYLEDMSTGIDEGKYASVEYIRKVINTPTHQLSFGAGLAYLDFAYTDNTSLDGVGGLLSYDYNGKLTSDISFKQKTLFQATSDLRYNTINTGLSYALTENTSLALTHNYIYISEVPMKANKDDQSTNLKLSINF